SEYEERDSREEQPATTSWSTQLPLPKDHHRSIDSAFGTEKAANGSRKEHISVLCSAGTSSSCTTTALASAVCENTRREPINNMRRTRRSSFDTAAGTGDGGGGGSGFGLDQKRRAELLAEARRKRVAWVEEARGIDDGVDGARKRREDEAAASGRKAEGELERQLFPSAVKFHDFLTGLAGDREESPAG
ncbi:unnamed protein product, partial [Ectocarpus fasciculatus]